MNYYDSPCTSHFYHDLRDCQDDRTVLSNPHKGWYFHYVDNGMRAAHYRSTLKKGDHLHGIPAINHMYIRFDWSDIEEEEGVYHWEKLDHMLDEWGREGYRVALRLCTYEANRPMISHATPPFVFAAGAACTINHCSHAQNRAGRLPGQYEQFISVMHADPAEAEAIIRGENDAFDTWEPDYGDPIFLEKLENFMREYGRRYDGHPLIEFIDVGTFGTWGEGHTTSGSGKSYPLSVIKKHIDLHLKYFPNTCILVNDDMINHVAAQNPQQARYLIEYCAAMGMGARDDSLYVRHYCDTCGSDMLSNPTMFDALHLSAPVDLERTHMMLISEQDNDGGWRMLDAIKRTHASFAGFHGDAYAWYAQNKGFHDYVANRLGYWYFIEGYEYPDILEQSDAFLTLHLSNRGSARAYYPYAMRIIARNERGEEWLLNRESPDNRRWLDGETIQERLRLHTRELPEGAYTLHIGLFEEARPILLGMKAERRDEKGYYLLGRFEIHADAAQNNG